MVSGIYLNESVWSSPLVEYNKAKGRGPTSEETRQDHAIRSSVAITKLPLGRDILKAVTSKKRRRKEEKEEQQK